MFDACNHCTKPQIHILMCYVYMPTCGWSVYVLTTVRGELTNTVSGTEQERWLCILCYTRQLGFNSAVKKSAFNAVWNNPRYLRHLVDLADIRDDWLTDWLRQPSRIPTCAHWTALLIPLAVLIMYLIIISSPLTPSVDTSAGIYNTLRCLNLELTPRLKSQYPNMGLDEVAPYS